ncbi:hypothetical protein CBR_g46409 [Chara braunii]|nr:hypothetical protein CBR_g46409 [Chara braunii]|eukprot:GBG88039.1 hypothetical protein CBR_g46409 [Chara braunii]
MDVRVAIPFASEPSGSCSLKVVVSLGASSLTGILSHLWVPRCDEPFAASNKHLYGVGDHVAALQGELLGKPAQKESRCADCSASSSEGMGPKLHCIVGMGGVGKTAITRRICGNKEVQRRFRDGMFFFTCGQRTRGSEVLAELWKEHQKKRVAVACHEGYSQQCVNGMGEWSALKRSLNGKRVLVVIDDVWRTEQISWTWKDDILPASCSVIVTTRIRDVVTVPVASTIFVQPLGEEDSFKLFCQSAFGSTIPPSGFQTLAKRVCGTCAGLPLALQEFGSRLYPRNRDLEFWDHWLDHLRGGFHHPARQPPGCGVEGCHDDEDEGDSEDDVVTKALRRSIDDLAHRTPGVLDMFLDLASFPQGSRILRSLIEQSWSIYPSILDTRTARERLKTLIRLSMVEDRGDFHVSLNNMMRVAAMSAVRSSNAPPVVLGQSSSFWSKYCGGEKWRRKKKYKNGAAQERLFLLGHETSAPDAALCQRVKKFSWFESELWVRRVILSFPWAMPHLVSFFWAWPDEQKLDFVNDPDNAFGRQFLERIAAKSHKLMMLTLLNFPSPNVFPPGYFTAFPNLRLLHVKFAGGNLLIGNQSLVHASLESLSQLQVLHLECMPKTMLNVHLSAFGNLKLLRVLKLRGVLLVNDNSERNRHEMTTGGKTSSDEVGMRETVEEVEVAVAEEEEEEEEEDWDRELSQQGPRKRRCLMPSSPSATDRLPFGNAAATQDGDGVDDGGVLQKLLQSKVFLEEFSISLPEGGRLASAEADGRRVLDEALPTNIGELRRLRSIEIEGFKSLTRLPDELGHLSCLVKLRINSSSLRSLPLHISRLSSLTHLEIVSPKLESIPEEVCDLTTLRKLNLQHFGHSLPVHLPRKFGNLAELRELDLSYSGIVNLPESISRICRLEKLDLSFANQLRGVPEGITNLGKLKELRLRGCAQLRTSHFDILRFLSPMLSEGSTTLEKSPASVGDLRSLTALDLSYAEEVIQLPTDIANLTGLTRLDLKECARLESLPEEITQLSNLESLNLSGCEKLARLPPAIGNLTKLGRELNLKKSSIQELPDSVSRLTGLTSLVLSYCAQLRALPMGVSSLTALKQLDLSSCVELRTLPEGIVRLENLQELDLSGCKELGNSPPETSIAPASITPESTRTTTPESTGRSTTNSRSSILEPISGLSGLTVLNLSSLSWLCTLPSWVSYLCNLQVLRLRDCSALQTLPEEISELTKMERLELGGCARLTYLPTQIGQLARLRELELSRSGIVRLPESVTRLQLLTRLDLTDAQDLVELPTGLEDRYGLVLKGCRSLTSPPSPSPNGEHDPPQATVPRAAE